MGVSERFHRTYPVYNLFLDHLNLLEYNFMAYLPEDNDKRLKANSWIMKPFIDEPTEDEALLELQANLN